MRSEPVLCNILLYSFDSNICTLGWNCCLCGDNQNMMYRTVTRLRYLDWSQTYWRHLPPFVLPLFHTMPLLTMFLFFSNQPTALKSPCVWCLKQSHEQECLMSTRVSLAAFTPVKQQCCNVHLPRGVVPSHVCWLSSCHTKVSVQPHHNKTCITLNAAGAL